MGSYRTITKKHRPDLARNFGKVTWDRKDLALCADLAYVLRSKGRERWRNFEFYHSETPSDRTKQFWQGKVPHIPLKDALTHRNHYFNINRGMSTAMREVWRHELASSISDNGVFLDAGCGDSADGDVALMIGFSKAIGIDLVPQMKDERRDDGTWLRSYDHNYIFKQADLCERLPIKAKSVDVVSSSAVTGLMDRKERDAFYRQVYRMLKPGGLFSVYGIYLVPGRGLVHQSEEKQRLIALGFEFVRGYQEGMVVQKP